MRRAHWSARPHSARAARIAVPLAIALVVGVVLGLKLIGGPGSLSLSAQGAGACATPSTATSATPSTAASTTPSTAASATSSATAATAPVAAANVSYDIIVPADPLSAAGLATAYQLTGAGGMTAAASGCTTANSAK